jgi:adenosylcobinamide-GDP ribazoletransferase
MGIPPRGATLGLLLERHAVFYSLRAGQAALHLGVARRVMGYSAAGKLPRKMFDPFWTALMTLTRIPAPRLAAAPDSATIGRSAVCYPLIGGLLGALAAAVYYCLDPWFPRGILAIVILGFWALLTGALHEDGLADTFDAFGSQRSPDGILRVLKDSRIGAYGALALVLAILLRWQGLIAIDRPSFAPTLIALQTLPRAGIVALAYVAGPATEGTGSAFARAVRPHHVFLTLALATAICGPLLPGEFAALTLSCLGVVAVCAIYFRRRLGGVTGDCLGAANQLQEIAMLLTLVALSGAA